MTDGLIKILDGNTFAVSDERGDIEASLSDPTGLFSYDTRFLSRWVLTIDGQRLNALSTDDLQYFETRFFLVPGTGTVYVDAKLSVIRQRAVGDGFHESLTLINHEQTPVDVTVRIEADSDFADLFEVKDALKKHGTYTRRVDDGRLILGYQRGSFKRQTAISSSEPAQIDEHGLTYTVHIEPHEAWATDVDVVTALIGFGEARIQPKYVEDGSRPRPSMQQDLGRWLDDAPRVVCDWEPLTGIYRRSLVDLAALRFSPTTRQGSEPAGRGAAMVHDHVRPRQHLHQLAGAAVHAGAGRDNPPRARPVAGEPRRRLPRRGSRQDPPRDALRRDDGIRRAAAFALLRHR